MIKMNYWKSFFVLVVVLFSGVQVFSQVGGISGSKLGAVCVDVVDHKKIEFGPDFTMQGLQSIGTAKVHWRIFIAQMTV